jgi:UDP-4-amino-4-deoxy-L-arabinose formyltransferase/UDP-glucuronic acid dehydrogenase (UDP-4-keto-hexauronic acid decarboxylating)
MHGSLLPKYRGRAPVHWAILKGETETGASLHYMVEKPDAGALVDSQAVPILENDTALDVSLKVAAAAEQVLRRSLPKLLAGSAPARPLDLKQGAYFGKRTPEDGRIDWRCPARSVHDLVRAVAPPFPGAFTEVNGCRLAILETRVDAQGRATPPRRLVCTPRTANGMPTASMGGGCGSCAWRSTAARRARRSAARVVAPAAALELRRAFLKDHFRQRFILKNVLILGVNGFIGHHLSKYILAHTDWHIYGMDLQSERVSTLLGNPNFHFVEGDITINLEWVEYHVRKCDVILPLVAIATPATYVREPLRVFELDFEANLPIIRHCVKYKKRVVFPSTSEVYGASKGQGVRPRHHRTRARPHSQAALDLLLREAALGSHHLCLWPAGTAVHAVPALQLDRLGIGQHG